MTVVGFVTLEKTADGRLLVAHDGEPWSRDEAIEEIAVCGAEHGGTWVLARVVIDEED